TRVNVSVFLPTVDSANCPWPTWRRSAAGLFAVGQRVARSFPERWPADLLRGHEDYGSRPSTRAQGGAAWSLPLLIGGRKWTPSRATSLCSPSCRCPAQSPPGRGIETFLARCFLPSVQSQCSARPMGSGADISFPSDTICKRRPVGYAGLWFRGNFAFGWFTDVPDFRRPRVLLVQPPRARPRPSPQLRVL